MTHLKLTASIARAAGRDAATPQGESQPSNDPVQEVFDHWSRQIELVRHQRITPKMRKHIRARLKDGYTVEQICRAIDRYAELVRGKAAPGYNQWRLEQLCGRGEGEWIERMLDPGYKGIQQSRRVVNAEDRFTRPHRGLGTYTPKQ